MNQQGNIICPLCGDKVEKLLYRYHLDNENVVVEKIREHNPEWTVNDGLCSRCVDYYHTEVVMQQRLLPEIGPYFPIKSADDFIILPTPLRLDADARYTGKGITICFIDSGFYLHPDLTEHSGRIKKVVDITNDNQPEKYFQQPQSNAWHGTMTSVVCAGDGFLSNGLYKGIASEAELVLLKVMNDEGHITTENIVKALQWVLKNYRKYNIRIVNMSLGDELPISFKQSEIDSLAEELVEKGIVVVAAVGNDEYGAIKPPANSPHVIAVGGVDDRNQLGEAQQLYHSTYGETVDKLMKPELLAHSIWIAAPILPETKEQLESALLHELLKKEEADLLKNFSGYKEKIQLDDRVFESDDVTFIRESVINRIQACKYISPHYMHVDGTSFAAPVVCSVIAQMLQASPQLSPPVIREVLYSTAKRIPDLPAERQGFGIIKPRKAILKILKKELIMKQHLSPYINSNQKTIEFYVHHDCASQISLSGSFNNWAQDVLLMEPGKNGLWKIRIPMLPKGTYKYKFLVDDKMWMEDVDNPYREPDGFHGFNSILEIKN